MAIKKIWEKDEDGMLVKYICEHDGTVLAIEYENGAQMRGDSCPHFVWEPTGNGCYPVPQSEEICQGTDEIVKNSVLKVDQGTTIWFLVPRQ